MSLVQLISLIKYTWDLILPVVILLDYQTLGKVYYNIRKSLMRIGKDPVAVIEVLEFYSDINGGNSAAGTQLDHP